MRDSIGKSGREHLQTLARTSNAQQATGPESDSGTGPHIGRHTGNPRRRRSSSKLLQAIMYS